MINSCVAEVFGYIDNLNRSFNEIEDFGIALLKFENGSSGIIESSMNTYPENFEEKLSIFGEKGSVVQVGKSLNRINHWNVKDNGIIDLKVFSETHDSIYGNGHDKLFKNLIEAIADNTDPLITLFDGRRTVEVILAIYKSSREERLVKLSI